MSLARLRRVAPTAIAIIAVVCAAHAREEVNAPPLTIYWEGGYLARIRAGELADDPAVRESLARLRRNANLALERGPYSVMQKSEVAPSGDKHDYLSFARYWWPSSDTHDGQPYVRRDGRTNPQALAKGDRRTIGAMYDDVETLALAGYLFDEKRYSRHAAKLIRVWFLDPATRMNPHMRYGQAIPGSTEGRGSGIIDTRHFIRVLDSVALLHTAESWQSDDEAGLTTWMRQYLEWLRSAPQAESERTATNNHGTWYDAQVARIALYVGNRALAKEIVNSAKRTRVANEIAPDGSQPAELVRTKSLHYSVFNLSALSVLARIGEHVDVDLWNYSTQDGRSIRSGLDFVLPFLLGHKTWPHEQISTMSVSPNELGLFILAAARYRDPRYLQVLRQANPAPEENAYASLLFLDK